MKRWHRGSWTFIAGLLLASSACALGTGGAAGNWQASDSQGAVYLNVANHSNAPMEVYAAGGGSSYRMGTVYPGLASRFELRPGMVVGGPVEFWARSGRGAPLVRSGQLLLSPGAVVDFELAMSPLNSLATVRPSSPLRPPRR